MLIIILILIFSSFGDAAASDNQIRRENGHNHNCEKDGKLIKIDNYGMSWGHLVTPGFPDSIQSPLRCSWLLNNTKFWRDPLKHLFLYATQVYVKKKFIKIQECQDSKQKNCTRPRSLIESRATILKGPYIKISLNIPDSPDFHLRFMELHNMYGVNITYEVAKSLDRINKFNCSAQLCHYNGRCIVQASEDDTQIDRMECRCNSPVDDSTSHFSGPFIGAQCQYHTKHGHCSGPADGHRDSRLRCNNNPCYYLTSRMVKCNCTDGAKGDRCQFKDEKDSGELQSGPNAKRFELKASFSGRYEDIEEVKMKTRQFLIRMACKPNICTITDMSRIENMDNRLCLLIEFETADYLVNQDLASLETYTLSAKLKVTFHSQVGIVMISSNKDNPINTGEVFVITCQTKGSKNLTVSWFKDGLMVDPTTNSNDPQKRGERYISQNPVTDGVLLHIEHANRFDSGVFRCVVRDNVLGLTVAKDLDTAVLVSSQPQLEVLPSSLVLSKVARQIESTSMQDTTIFCFTKGVLQKPSLYKFRWFKRLPHQRIEQNKAIIHNKAVERIEMLDLPVGSLLRLADIKESAIYTCEATMGNSRSYLEIAVTLLQASQVQTKTCPRIQDKNGNWPRSMLDTKVQISCPNNDYGQMTRVCANGIKPDIRTEPGKWGPVDQDKCVTRNLMDIKEFFETFKSGYVNQSIELWPEIVKRLWYEIDANNGRGHVARYEEWQLYLQILQQCLSYLKNFDKGEMGQNKWNVTRQIGRTKKPDDIYTVYFLKIIKYLLVHFSSFERRSYVFDSSGSVTRSSVLKILQVLRWYSLLLARNVREDEIARTYEMEPHAYVCVKKINLTKIDQEVALSEKHTDKNDSQTDFFPGVNIYLRGPPSMMATPKSSLPQNIYMISVIIIDQMKNNIEIPKESWLKPRLELRSQLVTISLEAKVTGRRGEELYSPRDMISMEQNYVFKIMFQSYRMNQTNQSDVGNISLQCGRMYESKVMMKNASECRLEYTTWPLSGDRVPTCFCVGAGTYALLEVLPSIPHSLVPDQLPLVPVIYGCLTSLILSFLSWALLVKSYKQSPKKFNTIYKMSTCFSVLMSSLLFLLQLNAVFPAQWTHTASCILQVTMLTGLSSQLGMGIHLLAEYRIILHSRLSHIFVCMISCLGPAIIISILSAGCNNTDHLNGDWWVLSGGYHFSSYISVLCILLAFLVVILAFLSYIIFNLESATHHYAGGCENSGGAAGSSLSQHRSALKTIILVSICLVVYNVSSVMFVNCRDTLQLIAAFLFSFISVVLGFAIILCYIHSDSYILVSCGEKSQDEWPDFKRNEVQMRGSRSDSGSSRLTTSSSVFQQRYNSKLNKKESLPRVSDIQEVLYEDPDLHTPSVYPLTSLPAYTSRHNSKMSVFTGTLPNSPPRNPPPLPKRATCYLKDSSPSVSGQPIPPFPPPAFMPPAVPAMVSKEPEPLDIVIGRASKEQSAKIPLATHMAGSGSISNEITSSSRRTTLSLATSLESEYVPPHGHATPSPLQSRFGRTHAGFACTDADTDQEDDCHTEFSTMVLARYRSGDNYTEMTSPLSPMSQISQTESIADMMARESCALSKSASSNPSQTTHREVESRIYTTTPTQTSTSMNVQTAGENIERMCNSVARLCNQEVTSAPSTSPNHMSLSTEDDMKDVDIRKDISTDLLNISYHQLPDYLNTDRAALLNALLASIKLKSKQGSDTLPAPHSLQPAPSTCPTAKDKAADSLTQSDEVEQRLPANRSTRALSTPTQNIFQTDVLLKPYNSSTRIFENILNDSLSVSAHNISGVHLKKEHGSGANMMTDHNISVDNIVSGHTDTNRFLHQDACRFLKKIQSASEMCSSSGSDCLSTDDSIMTDTRRKKIFPSEI